MAKTPSIAIFAQSGAKTAYLTTLATLAGLEVSQNPDADIYLAESTPPKGARSELIFVLGEGKNTENVRFIPIPAKAAAIIGILQNAHRAGTALQEIISLGNYTLDTRESLWTEAGKNPVRLTEKEVAILSHLAQSKGLTIGREDLLSCVWSYAEGVETHTLETHIYRLRQKIESDPSTPIIILTKEEGYALGV